MYSIQENKDENASEDSTDIEEDSVVEDDQASEVNKTRLQAIAAQLHQINPMLTK